MPEVTNTEIPWNYSISPSLPSKSLRAPSTHWDWHVGGVESIVIKLEEEAFPYYFDSLSVGSGNTNEGNYFPVSLFYSGKISSK